MDDVNDEDQAIGTKGKDEVREDVRGNRDIVDKAKREKTAMQK